jgi:hypothetical protein
MQSAVCQRGHRAISNERERREREGRASVRAFLRKRNQKSNAENARRLYCDSSELLQFELKQLSFEQWLRMLYVHYSNRGDHSRFSFDLKHQVRSPSKQCNVLQR